jgi:hypothetical protein
MLYYNLYICSFIISTVIYGIFDANQKSIELYKKAENHAFNENKLLLVLGSPYTASGKLITTFTNTYGCGDICIDMNGCGLCNNSIDSKIENVSFLFNSSNYIIFESGLLEVVDDNQVNFIVKELYRIAGKKENIYGRHYIQKYKWYYDYFGKYAYSYLGEGSIQRFVDKYPPLYNYSFTF